MIRTWKKTGSESIDNTIKLLQDEVMAQKNRLETTTLQVTQLTTQIISLSSTVDTLKKENEFLKELIDKALNTYFKENGNEAVSVQARIQA